MPTQDQVVWSSVNIAKTGGDTESYNRGALLPPPADLDEAAARNLLRIGGAIRTVEVVYTQEELAEHAMAHAERGAARAAALDVDPGVPLGSQMPGGGTPGPPTLETPGGTPVVVGHEPAAEPPVPAAKPVPKTDPAPKPAAGTSSGTAKAKG
jgi:hypothetical protein